MANEAFHACGIFYDAETHRVLLHLRDGDAPMHANRWGLFGGGSDGDERPRETFVREIREELGLNLSGADFHEFRSYRNPRTGTMRHVFVVERPVHSDEVVLGEGAGFEWHGVDDCRHLDLTPGTRDDLLCFLDGLQR